MRGTRYGDFSRFITGLRTHQTALLMQQGRVQLDADWNAQAELAGQRLSRAVADILGASGTPATDPGFEVRPREELEFSGHGAVLTHRRLALGQSGTASFTIEMRVRWGGGAGTLIELTGERGGHGRGEHLRLSVRSDGTLVFSQHHRDGEQRVDSDVVSDEPLTAGTTAQVAVVCRDGEASLWVHSRSASRRLARVAPADERLVLIGAAAVARGRGHFFTGVIGDVRIWGTALPGGELGALLQGGRALPRELLAWWPLDGPSGAGLDDRVSGERAAPDGTPPPRWQLTGLQVSPGRFYVAGHLVALDEPLVLPGAELPPGHHLVYLEVWEDSVSVAEDPALAEPALGGLDSIVRTDLVFDVRWTPVPRHRERDAERLLRAALHADGTATTGDLAADHRGQPVTGNWLYRVEVHRGGHTEAELTEVAVTVDAAGGTVTLAEAWTGHGTARGEAEFTGVAADGQEVTVRYTVEPVGDAPGRRTLRVAAGAAELGRLGNLRLRQPMAQPTFKWSRTNGADTIAVRAVQDQPATFLVVPGPLPIPPLAPGQVVEALGKPCAGQAGQAGQPGTLRQIVGYDSGTGQITLDQDLAVAGDRDVRLRLWDQAPGPSAADGAVPLTTGDWIGLEHGVRVRFQRGYYRAGDYWWIPVRQEGDTVLWDRRDGHPRFRGPDGIERCRAPLAMVEIGEQVRVRDLRGRLRPVVRPAALDAPPDGEAAAPEESAETGAGPEPPAPAGTSADTAGSGPASGAHGNEEARDDGDDYDDEDGAPSIPSGFAMLGPAGATPPGWRSTGVAVATQREWTAPVPLALPEASPPIALAVAGDGLLLITATDIWTVELASGELAHRSALPEPRIRFGCAAIGDTILLLGGRRRGAERPDGRVLSFDVSRGIWLTGRRPLITAVDNPAVAVAADGGPRVHLLGGAEERGERASRRHQIYDPTDDQWTVGPLLDHPRRAAAAGAAGAVVYLFGGTAGRRGEEHPLSSVEVYDDHAGTWSEGPALPAAGAVTRSAAVGGQLVAAVAPAAGQALRVAVLDAEAGVWAGLPYPPRRVQSPVLALREGRLFLVGIDPAGQVILMTLPPEQRWLLFEPEAPGEADR